jgi:hypothetical protein
LKCFAIVLVINCNVCCNQDSIIHHLTKN